MEGDDGDEAWTRSMESDEAPGKVPIRESEHFLASAEIKFTIPKERYEEVKTAMRNGSNCCHFSSTDIILFNSKLLFVHS